MNYVKGDSRDMRSSNPNHYSTKERAALWVKPAVILTVGMAALTGCVPGSTPGPEATASAPASPEATQPAVDRYEGSDFERKDALPADLEAANNASPEAFAQLPKSEQIRWATWAAQYKADFITYFDAVSISNEDGPYTLTADSDVKLLILDRSYDERIAANFGSGTPASIDTNGPVDRNMVLKYMTAFTVDSEEATTKISAFASNIGDGDGQAQNVVRQARSGDYDMNAEIAASQDFTSISNTMVVDGESIPCYRVSWTAADGSGSSSFNIGAYSTENYKNQPVVVTIVSQ
jgi:hypothetical protein